MKSVLSCFLSQSFLIVFSPTFACSCSGIKLSSFRRMEIDCIQSYSTKLAQSPPHKHFARHVVSNIDQQTVPLENALLSTRSPHFVHVLYFAVKSIRLLRMTSVAFDGNRGSRGGVAICEPCSSVGDASSVESCALAGASESGSESSIKTARKSVVNKVSVLTGLVERHQGNTCLRLESQLLRARPRLL